MTLIKNLEKISAWLEDIGEYDPDIRIDILKQAKADQDAFAYYSKMAAFADRTYRSCRCCMNYSNGTGECSAAKSRYRPVPDLRKRCTDFFDAAIASVFSKQAPRS